jgi:LCP family protein required for cell wall assembly
MTSSRPMRYPDINSEKVMTTRGWWLVALNFLLPGAAQALAGNKRLGRFGLGATLAAWGIIVAGFLLGLLWPAAVYFLGTWNISLFLGQIAMFFYAILWIALTFDTLRLVKIVKTTPKARGWIAAFSVVLLVLSAGGIAYAGTLAGGLNGALSKIFVSGPAQPPVDGRYNFLLLGGDSGADREGLRPDTTQVVSIEAATGAATIIGIPRDLQSVPFSADSPMLSVYPEGYSQDSGEYCTRWACLNTIYVAAEMDHPDLYPNAVAEGSSPGIEAMKDAAEGVTGLKIQYFVLIDMQGLSDLIDSLGGVDIDVTERIAIAEPEVLQQDVQEWIEIGPQHLDGFHALMYARSRWSGQGDYDRMVRQQELQTALLQQMNPTNVLTKFQEIAVVGTQVVKTNIPQSMLGYFVDLGMKTRALPMTQIALTPASTDFPVDTEYPDFPAIQAYLHDVLFPPVSTEAPTSN